MANVYANEDPGRSDAHAPGDAGASPEVGAPPDSGTTAVSGTAAAAELLDVVDDRDRVLGQATRGVVYAHGLTHRSVFVLVRDPAGRIFVHRRTPTKMVCPSLYDMWVGGVVGAGESYDDAALREAQEELGVPGLPRPEPLTSFLFTGSGEFAGRSWWCRLYRVRCAAPVRPQVEEVAWHTFLTEEELERVLPEWEWTPDGLEAWRRLRALPEPPEPPRSPLS
jgi:isopentenyldiphosphate isomerase